MIRDAAPADAPRLAAIWNRVIRESTAIFASTERGEEEVAALTREGPFFVWEKGGRIGGFARYFPFRAGNGYAHTVEHTVLVDPWAQGRGVGRALVAFEAVHARAAGKHTLWAAVSADNAPALAFHQACGFEPHGHLPEVGRKFGRWLDVILLGLRL